MVKQTAVRLPEETYQRLQALAKRTGRTATYYIHEAIEEHLDDLEDAYLGEQALEQLRQGNDTTMTLEEVEHDLGLAVSFTQNLTKGRIHN